VTHPGTKPTRGITPRASSRHQAVLHRVQDEFRLVAKIHLAQKMRLVGADRLFADLQLVRDFRAAPPRHQHLEDPVLALQVGAPFSHDTYEGAVGLVPDPVSEPQPNELDGHVDPRQIMDVGTMNGSFPAPMFVIDEGDEFFLTLTNVGQIMRPDLFEQHTVHFHGYPNACSSSRRWIHRSTNRPSNSPRRVPVACRKPVACTSLPSGPAATPGVVCNPDGYGYYTTGSGAPANAPNYYEWCKDHDKPLENKPFGLVGSGGPVTLPDPNLLANGPWYGGSPYLGPEATARAVGDTPIPPSGTVGNSPTEAAGFAYMWHSHNERELTTNNIFPGGMMMMMLVDPWSFQINEAN